MSIEILQLINFLLLVGVVVCVYILVRNSGRSAKALEDIAKNVGELVEKK